MKLRIKIRALFFFVLCLILIGGVYFYTVDATTQYGSGVISPSSGQLAVDGDMGINAASANADLEVDGSVIIDSSNRGAVTYNAENFYTGTNSAAYYIHIRLPLFLSWDNAMYHITARGYAYGASTKIVNITWVGYCYNNGDNLIMTQSYDATSGFSPTQYVGSDRYIYLRFKPSNVYFLTFTVESRYVGNGRVIEPGEITISQSTSATL